MELLLTFLVGIFILIGAFIVLKIENNDRLVSFSISMAFGVMLTLVIIELIPESFELLQEEYTKTITFGIILVATILGILLLKVLDYFVPDHELEKQTPKAKKDNLLHISIVSSIALILHNIIEGMAIYSSALSDLSMGFMISLGVGLHNIPMGMVVASTYYKANNSKKKTIIICSIVAIATFLGGLMMFIFGETFLSNTSLGLLLSITLGMLLYIIFFELFPQIKQTKYKKETILGIVIGIILLLISMFFE